MQTLHRRKKSNETLCDHIKISRFFCFKHTKEPKWNATPKSLKFSIIKISNEKSDQIKSDCGQTVVSLEFRNLIIRFLGNSRKEKDSVWWHSFIHGFLPPTEDMRANCWINNWDVSTSPHKSASQSQWAKIHNHHEYHLKI